jgi:hypothetical protein
LPDSNHFKAVTAYLLELLLPLEKLVRYCRSLAAMMQVSGSTSMLAALR